MPSIFTLGGSGKSKRRRKGAGLAASVGDCKCVYNPRTKRSAKLCFVGKSGKNRSGWQFTKGSCSR